VLRNKKWIIIGVVGVVVVLVAGVVGAVVIHAQSPTPPTSANATLGKAFADRVATILGVPPATVEAAFTQAQKDMQSEALKSRLDPLVKANKITQAQEDQYLQWWNSRPNVQIGPVGRMGQMGPMMGGQGFKGGFHGMPRPGFGKPPAAPSAKPVPSVTP
jgi:hypothetical protein